MGVKKVVTLAYSKYDKNEHFDFSPKTKVYAQKKKVESKKCFSVRQKKPKSENVEKKKRNFLW